MLFFLLLLECELFRSLAHSVLINHCILECTVMLLGMDVYDLCIMPCLIKLDPNEFEGVEKICNTLHVIKP